MKELIIGCNYHVSWADKKMRFVLVEVDGNIARLQTRKTNKDFTTSIHDLVFISSNYNKDKAKKYLKLAEQYKDVKPLTFGKWKDVPLYIVPLQYIQYMRKKTGNEQLIEEEKRRNSK